MDRESTGDGAVRGTAGGVAARQREAADLRAALERFASLADGTPTVMWATDPAGAVEYVNRAYCEFFGVTEDQVRTSGWQPLVHPDDAADYVGAFLRSLRERAPFHARTRVRHASGEWRWIESFGAPRFAPDGAYLGAAGSSPDVTDRVRSERNLAFLADLTASLAPLASSHEIAQVAAVALGRHFEASRVNLSDVDPDSRTVTVYEGERDAGLDDRVTHALADYLPEPLIDDLAAGRVVALGDVARDPRTASRAAAYAQRHIGAVVLVPHLTDGACRFMVAVHKAGPHAWRRDEIDLLREVVARVHLRIERARAEEALRESDRRKDEFLAMLAHELRNPLAPMRNAAELLRLAAADNPAVQSARGIIERQVTHLVRLVDDLLDVSRVSRGKLELQLDRVDLARVAAHAVETVRPLVDGRRQRLSVRLPAAPVRVEGDFTRLAQVIANLLGNAAKFTDAGGSIELAVAREGDGDGAEGVVRVRDTGRGFDPLTARRLFELFYQADRGLDRAEGGLGIGLALVRSLVEMHGGKVEAFSRGPAMGSEFVVRLPAIAQDAEAAVPIRADAPSPAPLRILVVDDNRDAADSTALLLTVEGHRVDIAYDGREGIERALAARPDVVLLDLGLPSVDGFEACRAMRQAGLTDALIVALSGYGQDEDRARAVQAGFDAHQLKPVELDALRALLAARASRPAREERSRH